MNVGRRGRPSGGMVGTGPLRRGGRRGVGGRLGDVARDRMQQARAHYRAGAYAEAAQLFERMAGVARERDLPRVAVHLGVRAAACHAQLGNAEAFDTWVAHALADAAQEGDRDRSARTFGRLVQEMKDTPLASRSDDLVQSVRSQLGVVPKAPERSEVKVNRAVRRHLPKVCASCGAPVDPDTIEFNEDGSVDCDTCGALVSG